MIKPLKISLIILGVYITTSFLFSGYKNQQQEQLKYKYEQATAQNMCFSSALGRNVNIGESYPAGDGCNSCKCGFGCTEMGCAALANKTFWERIMLLPYNLLINVWNNSISFIANL